MIDRDIVKTLFGNKFKLIRGKLIYTLCGTDCRKVFLDEGCGRQVILHRKEDGNNYKILDLNDFCKNWMIVN